VRLAEGKKPLSEAVACEDAGIDAPSDRITWHLHEPLPSGRQSDCADRDHPGTDVSREAEVFQSLEASIWHAQSGNCSSACVRLDTATETTAGIPAVIRFTRFSPWFGFTGMESWRNDPETARAGNHRFEQNVQSEWCR
jgi:hypothetical protein